MPRRSRLRGLIYCACVILAGLGSRTSMMSDFVIAYVGDVLWGVMFYLLFACAFPAARVLRLWLLATAATELIELSELYRAPSILELRATRLGGLMLGHQFAWSDVLCVAIGTTTACVLDWVQLRRGSIEPIQRGAGLGQAKR